MRAFLPALGLLCGAAVLRGAGRGGRRTRRPRRRRTSDQVLLALGLFLLAFIGAMTAIFCVKGETPDTLIQCTLGAGGVEALLLAGIRISKTLAASPPPRSGGGKPEFPACALGMETEEREE